MDTEDCYSYYRACNYVKIYDDNDDTGINWYVNGDVFLAKMDTHHNKLSMKLNSNEATVNIPYNSSNIQKVKLPKFSNLYHIHKNESIISKSDELIDLLSNVTNIQKQLCSIIVQYIMFYIPIFEIYSCFNEKEQNSNSSKRHFTVPYFQIKEQFIDYINKCNQFSINQINDIKCVKLEDIDFAERKIFSMPNIIDDDNSQNENMNVNVSKWLQQLFEHNNCNNFHPIYNWEYSTATVGWKSYDVRLSKAIEQAYMEKMANYFFKIKSNQTKYKLDFNQMKQFNVSTNRTRIIRRVITENKCNTFKLDLYIVYDHEYDYDGNHKKNKGIYEYDEKSLRLIASKYNTSLTKLINMSSIGGSMWFEVTFTVDNDIIYLDNCDKLEVSIGGNNDASKSRHWFQINSNNPDIKFKNILPIVIISMATHI